MKLFWSGVQGLPATIRAMLGQAVRGSDTGKPRCPTVVALLARQKIDSDELGKLSQSTDSLRQALPFQRFEVLFHSQGRVFEALALLLGG